MRLVCGSIRFVSGLLLASISSKASAQLVVATPPDVADAVEHAELAYALGAGPPVTWVSLRVRGGPVALVAALPEGAVADAALDAWLSALEATASPRVLPQGETTTCGESGFVEVAWPRGAGAPPDELRLESPEDVASALAEHGLELTSKLPSATSYVMWSWAELQPSKTTRTLRVQGGATPLAFLPGATFPILVSAVTRGAMQYAGEVDAGALGVTFVAGPKPRSDYRARVGAWFDGRAQPLLETRSRGLLYDWSIHGDLVSIAPLVRSYALRARDELPGLDATACSHALAGLRNQTAAESGLAACAAAGDAALALRAADPELATLQRFVVSGAQGVSAESLSGGGQSHAPVVHAKVLDDSACPEAQQPPTVIDPVVSGGGPAPIGEPRGGGEVVVEETVLVEQRQPVEVDCTGSPGSERSDDDYEDDDDVDCSSDTSSSSDADGSEVDCAGDTSTTSDSGDDSACGSDSSSSSESDDASCGGGSEDSSQEDSGYDGDTCAGVAATPRPTQRSQAGVSPGKRQRGSRRLSTSLWSVAFAAFALPIRRRKRGARALS